MPLLAAATKLMDTDELRPAARKALGDFVRDIARWRSLLTTMAPAELTGLILDESGYTAMWKADPAPDAAGRLENLKELLRAIEAFDSIAGFLEHIALVMDAASENAEDMVTIMTLHAAKGLEYNTVFLPGWEEGLFPHQKALDETGPAGLEEERRLAYVGITRAKKSLTICHAANRRVHGQWQQNAPSRFLDELPPQLLERRQSFNSGQGGQAGQLSGYRGSGGSGGWGRSSYGGGGGGGNSGGGWGRGGSTGRSGAGAAGKPSAEPQSYARQLLIQNRDNTYTTPQPPPMRRVASANAVSGTISGTISGSVNGIGIGSRVRHKMFGDGTITAVDGTKLEVRFDRIGHKKVMASFVTTI
jgi:DNA helicase-2/ATP-dependent DNA helicase PcrA